MTTLRDDVYEAKMRTSPELDNLLSTAKYIGHNADDGRHQAAVGGWDHYSAVFEVGGKYYRGTVSLLVDEKGRRRFHDVTQIKEETLSQVDASTTQGHSASEAFPAHKVLQGQNPSDGSSDANTIPKSAGVGNGVAKMSAGSGRVDFDPEMVGYDPNLKAMGDRCKRITESTL